MIKKPQWVCSRMLPKICEEKIMVWVKGGSPGGAKAAKKWLFCHILAETKNIFLELLYILIKKTQWVCSGMLPNIYEEKIRVWVHGAAQGGAKVAKMTFFQYFGHFNTHMGCPLYSNPNVFLIYIGQNTWAYSLGFFY